MNGRATSAKGAAAVYQGMSVLANALRDPEIMTALGRRLTAWIDSLT